MVEGLLVAYLVFTWVVSLAIAYKAGREMGKIEEKMRSLR